MESTKLAQFPSPFLPLPGPRPCCAPSLESKEQWRGLCRQNLTPSFLLETGRATGDRRGVAPCSHRSSNPEYKSQPGTRTGCRVPGREGDAARARFRARSSPRGGDSPDPGPSPHQEAQTRFCSCLVQRGPGYGHRGANLEESTGMPRENAGARGGDRGAGGGARGPRVLGEKRGGGRGSPPGAPC